MIQAHQIDDAGYIIETMMVAAGTPDHDDIVTTPCQEGFNIPRWNGTAWEEGMNIYFEYVTAASCERSDGKILTTGEIMWASKGDHHGEWTEVDAGCAVIGPFNFATAPQIMLDAGEDTELYFIQDGVVLIKPNAEEIKRQREANRTPTIEERLASLQDRNYFMSATILTLKKQLFSLQSASTTTTN